MTGCNEGGGSCVLGFLFVGSLLCFFILVLPLRGLCFFPILKVLHPDKS